VIGAAGTIYALASSLCGAVMIPLAIRLDRSRYPDPRLARRLFAFSIVYLFVLCTALLADAAVRAHWPAGGVRTGYPVEPRTQCVLRRPRLWARDTACARCGSTVLLRATIRSLT